MNLITVNRYIDSRGHLWQKTDVFCEEQGAQGDRGDKGQQGVGISDATIKNGELVFKLTDNQTTPAGEMPKKTLKMANLGNIDGENKTFQIIGYDPMGILINGITYKSEYKVKGGSLTTTFTDNIPTGDVYLFYKEVQ